MTVKFFNFCSSAYRKQTEMSSIGHTTKNIRVYLESYLGLHRKNLLFFTKIMAKFDKTVDYGHRQIIPERLSNPTAPKQQAPSLRSSNGKFVLNVFLVFFPAKIAKNLSFTAIYKNSNDIQLILKLPLFSELALSRIGP